MEYLNPENQQFRQMKAPIEKIQAGLITAATIISVIGIILTKKARSR